MLSGGDLTLQSTDTCCFQLLAYTSTVRLPFGRIFFCFHDGRPFLLLRARLACILHLARRRKGCPGASRSAGVSRWREDPRELLEPDHVCLRDCLKALLNDCFDVDISDTGEHITDAAGQLSYIPFPTCNETGRPLELLFGVEKEINCTIDFIDDPFFHLLEFYVHNDAPLTCRIPTKPLPPSALKDEFEKGTTEETDGQGSLSDIYTPMVVALAGTLQLSHLHVATSMNVLVHAAPKSVSPGTIAAATAYSISREPPTRIVIGDPLPLKFSVRWYPTTQLPSGWTGVGGHLTFSTLVYCMLSALASAAICVTYFRGVELPRRLKSHGKDRLGGMERGGLGGYGLSAGGGNGYGYGIGKRD